jgi:hypothetical protein
VRASSRALLAAAVLLAFVATASAHDSWLRLSDTDTAADLLLLELDGGARYPRSEWPTPAARVAASGCIDARQRVALVPRAEHPTSLELRARISRPGLLACWVELKPQDIKIEPQLVQVYFDDIRAPAAVRQAWSQLQARGIPWTEVYRKFIRIELPQDGGGDLAALRHPLGGPLELVPVGGAPLRHGVEAEFLALADGKPVEGLAVEFVSRRSPIGIWRQSDGQGRLRFAAPFPGEWLLRSTALEIPRAPDHTWHSRFATLTLRIE